jgi:hypothetical protein
VSQYYDYYVFYFVNFFIPTKLLNSLNTTLSLFFAAPHWFIAFIIYELVISLLITSGLGLQSASLHHVNNPLVCIDFFVSSHYSAKTSFQFNLSYKELVSLHTSFKLLYFITFSWIFNPQIKLISSVCITWFIVRELCSHILKKWYGSERFLMF